jgi:imidazoleglycerol phosphate dehydratase HisB
MRRSVIRRKTKETVIEIKINLDGKGRARIETGIGFFDHMLRSLAMHSLFDIKANMRGDTNVDQHHLLEDSGIALGQAINKALGNKKGINRAGYFAYPMDDALALVAIDIGGRTYLQFNVRLKRRYCGELDTDVLEDFFYGLAIGLQANVVVRVDKGRSDHHKIEAIFKALARALRTACSRDRRALRQTPSLKGII